MKCDLYSKIDMFRTASYYYNRAGRKLIAKEKNSFEARRLILRSAESAANAGDEENSNQIIEIARDKIIGFELVYNMWLQSKRKKKVAINFLNDIILL